MVVNDRRLDRIANESRQVRERRERTTKRFWRRLGEEGAELRFGRWRDGDGVVRNIESLQYRTAQTAAAVAQVGYGELLVTGELPGNSYDEQDKWLGGF